MKQLQSVLLLVLCSFEITCSGNKIGAQENIKQSIEEYHCATINDIVVDDTQNTMEAVLNGSMDLNCSVILLNYSQSLSTTLTISSVHNLTVIGETNEEENVDIICSNNSGIYFWNFKGVALHQLNFIGCGSNYNLTEMNDVFNPEAAVIGIHFQSGSGLYINNCSFINGSGVGVVMNDVTGDILVSNTVFLNNKPSPQSTIGGGLIIHTTDQVGLDPFYCKIDSCFFINNQQSPIFYNGGGGFTLLQIQGIALGSILISDTVFTNNSASDGGGLHVANFVGNLTVTLHSCFFNNNTARFHGGGAWIVSYDTTNTKVNIAAGTYFYKNNGHRGGGLAIQTNATGENAFTLSASNSNWTVNTVTRSGSGIYLHSFKYFNSTVSNSTQYTLTSFFKNCSYVQNNIDRFHDIGAVYAESVKVTFNNCEFNENIGTALYLLHSTYVILSGYIHFQSNIGIIASAIHISYNSIVALEEGVKAYFLLNIVSLSTGGAIFMENYQSTTTHTSCVFDGLSDMVESNYSVSFAFNYAKNIYRSIFVSDTTNCFSSTNQSLLNTSVFTYIPNDNSQIASIGSNISIRGSQYAVMLGQTFQIHAEVYDIFGNPSVIHGYLLLLCIYDDNDDRPIPYVCHDFKNNSYELVGPGYVSMDKYTQNNSLYYIKGPRGGETKMSVTFLYDANGDTLLDRPKSFNVIIADCLPGFSYSSDLTICKCDDVKSENLVCESFDYSCIKSGYWYGVDNNNNKSIILPCPGLNCQYNDTGCNNMSTCPSSPGYCKLDNLSEQCYSGREGILCAYCHENYSFTFGALKCVNSSTCSAFNSSFVLIGVLLYWVLSIAVMFMVLSMKLSIGSGFIYGVVYYFSIVSVYTDSTINDRFLSTIVHTCVAITQMSPRVIGHAKFCFAENWDHNLHHYMFEYVTPVFITTAILLLIFSSRICRWPKHISLAENSSIHAISILILFSSSSLAYTSFEILKPLSIYGDLRVYKEPKYTYFGREHIPYALVAVGVEIFISLPICFLLLFAPCISKKLNLVKWKVKPIIDEFQACYRSECRWFAGFYFMARQLVYLANALSHAQSLPQENIFLHYVNAVILLIHVAFQPYSSRWLNILDAFLLADILMISFPETSLPMEIDGHIPRAFMYILILLPTLYLLGIIMGLFLRRIYASISTRITKMPMQKMVDVDTFTSHYGVTHSVVAIENSDGNINGPVRDSSHLTDSFFRDRGEREPLLATSQESQTEAVTSMTFSNMTKFPQFLTNRNTNKTFSN